jgi:hypothetical protein
MKDCRQRFGRLAVIGMLALCGCFGASCAGLRPAGPTAPGSLDATAGLERLGNPAAARYPAGAAVYARNAWTLRVSGGRLLIGSGNSSNGGPAPNAGPAPLFEFDPEKGTFRTVFTVDDEQIDGIRLLGGRLHIPGHDPRESWALGNFYRLEEDGRWGKHRTIPGGIHTYDMAASGGRLFAALGTAKGAAVAVSADSGATWTNRVVGNFRLYTLFESERVLYAAGPFPGASRLAFYRERNLAAPVGVFQHDGNGGFLPRPDLDAARMFPGIPLNPEKDSKLARAVAFRERAAYIGGYCHNDHQIMPFGAFVADSLDGGRVSVRPIPLAGGRPWDLLEEDGVLYVLVDTPDSAGTTVRVWAGPDGLHWNELFHFRAATFARSFALLKGDFYFGLGCEVADPQAWKAEELPPETGAILRLRKEVWSGGKQRQP